MKKILTALAISIALSASAQISFNGSYSTDFDTLPTTTQTLQFSATNGVQSGIFGLTGWEGAKLSGTNNTTAVSLLADAGSTNSGAIYSYGAASATDRALGLLASGTNIMAFGVSFTNSTAGTIDTLKIDFTSEFWRSSTSVTNVLSFAHGFSGGTITTANYLSSASMTAEANLNVNGPAFVTSNGALDGNALANQQSVSYTFTSLNWTSGSTLFLRWTDVNDAGNDAGLAIDNFSMTAIPEPSTYAVIMGLLTLGVVAYRRRKKA